MIINRLNLLSALEIVKPGLSNKDIIEQATSFAFNNGAVITYNDEISVSHPIEDIEFNGAVKAEELYKLLNKIKQEEIEITTTENELIIKSGKSEAGLIFESDIKLPIDAIGEIGKWKKLPESFCQALKFVSLACSNDMSKPILTTVHVSENGFMEGSDMFRIVRFNCELPKLTYLIPSSSVSSILQIKPTKVSLGNSFVHFKNAVGTVLSCRIFEDDEYPDCERFLNMEGTGLTLPETTKEILEKAIIFNRELIDVSLKEKSITISSKSESGRFKEQAPIKFKSEPFSFRINPILLKDILSETLNCSINEQTLSFEGDNWKYVTALNVE